MGKSFPLHLQFQYHHVHQNMTMKLQVMSNLTKSSPASGYCNGEAESMPAISVVDFSDVDILNDKIKANSAPSHLNDVTAFDSNNDELESSEMQIIADDVKMEEHILDHQSKDRESLCDDTDATLSVSSDKTLEFDPGENQLKNQLANMTLNVTEKENAKHIPSGYVDQRNPEYANVMQSPLLTDDVAVEVGPSARFSKVLENISLPLLYIPTTKQLVKSGDEASPTESNYAHKELSTLYTPERDYSCNGSESTSSNLDLSSTELLSSRSPMHKAHSAQEFHYGSSKYTDSDRLTLHSMDSYPGFHHNFEPSPHLFADNSSLSSVSTGTDFSVSAVSVNDEFNAESTSLSHDAGDEALFMDINLHSRNSFDKGMKTSSLDSGYGDKRAPHFQTAKKKSFTSLKNLFTKRTKEESPPGWKLFGRIPPKSNSQRNAQEITTEFQARHRRVEKPDFPSTSNKKGSEVMSTTALILENRPTNLPTKSPEEAEKHRQQYEEMVEAAKKKEQKDMKMKKKQLQLQRKLEDQTMAAARVWDSEILPNWETMRQSKKARDLWWLGLPPNVRGKVWQLAIGNDLNITHALYNICHERAEERIRFIQDDRNLPNGGAEGGATQLEPSNKESSVKVIKLDVSRTFPQLCIFQKGGPFYDLLHNLLGAYACYRPDVGYVQGMSFIAAILLLNMDVADAFVCFANLLNRPCQLAFFRVDENLMTAYYRTFEEFFKENLPKLYAHFNSQSVTPNLYLMEWVFLLYSKSLPLDVACRVWDVFFRDGEEFLFRTAIAILKLHESVLLKMDFIHVAQFLTKLPEDISVDQLFKEIESVRMNIDKRGFHAVHAFFKDLHAGNS